MHPQSARRLARVTLLIPITLLAACAIPEIPSAAPIFQQTWVVPSDSVTVGVTQILPAGVVVNGAGTAFVVTTPGANINTTLGAVCGQAACQSGVTVSAPVPAFTSGAGALSTTIAFPSGVAGAAVTGGTVSLAVTNNLGFDPLRPNGAATAPFGRIIAVMTSGTATRTDTIVGSAAQGMPNGALTNLQFTLPVGTYTGSLSIAISLVVPAGAVASLNAANALVVATSLQNLAVSQATVAVTNRAINATPSAFDLSDIDFADQVEGGGLILDILNPFTATAALNIVISAGLVTITKPVNVPATPTSTTSVTLTKAELQSLLGKPNVTIGASGTANGTGAGNTVAVSPAQRITVRTKIQIVLNVGG